ncbi:MAG: pyridoxal phosphate-dependent aminotransferase [Paracoccaceae bacterium]
MQLSKRITGINGGGSDGWGLFYKARRMKAAGKPVLELSIGEHDIRTDPTILAAMNMSALGGHTGYPSVPGVESLRNTVAKRITDRTGVPTTMDNILITPGGQSALFAAHSAICDAGDRALYCDPYYATYPGTLRAVGAVPVAISTRPEHAFQPQRAEIDVVAPGAKSLLINSPNNPTGVVYSRKTLEDIAAACIDHDLWLISDEVYDTQVWQGEHISPRSLAGMQHRTLVVGSMSKSHAMTGSRCGWLIGPAEAIGHLINLATNTTYGVPGYIQDAADFALNAGPELEEKVVAPFRRRREIAMRIIAGQSLLRMVPSGGSMFVMLDIRATGLSGEAFGEALLDQELIAIMPGESFGKSAAGHIRVAMTVDDARFEDALVRLVNFAQGISQ